LVGEVRVSRAKANTFEPTGALGYSALEFRNGFKPLKVKMRQYSDAVMTPIKLQIMTRLSATLTTEGMGIQLRSTIKDFISLQ